MCFLLEANTTFIGEMKNKSECIHSESKPQITTKYHKNTLKCVFSFTSCFSLSITHRGNICSQSDERVCSPWGCHRSASDTTAVRAHCRCCVWLLPQGADCALSPHAARAGPFKAEREVSGGGSLPSAGGYSMLSGVQLTSISS